MGTVTEEPETDTIGWFPTDDRGRPTLGTEYGDREVKLAILDVRDK